jgi:hypothetical protein
MSGLLFLVLVVSLLLIVGSRIGSVVHGTQAVEPVVNDLVR